MKTLLLKMKMKPVLSGSSSFSSHCSSSIFLWFLVCCLWFWRLVAEDCEDDGQRRFSCLRFRPMDWVCVSFSPGFRFCHLQFWDEGTKTMVGLLLVSVSFLCSSLPSVFFRAQSPASSASFLLPSFFSFFLVLWFPVSGFFAVFPSPPLLWVPPVRGSFFLFLFLLWFFCVPSPWFFFSLYAWTISGFYSQRIMPFLQAINCVNCRCNGRSGGVRPFQSGRRWTAKGKRRRFWCLMAICILDLAFLTML